MQQISLIDETFNILNNKHYKITLQILLDSVSFTILDSVRKKYVLLNYYKLDDNENFNDVLKPLILNNEILKLNFEDFRLLVFSDETTIIPKTFSNTSKNIDYLKFNFGEGNSSNGYFCDSYFDSMLSFNLSKEINDIISSFNNKVIYPHSLSILKESQIVCLKKEVFSGVFLSLMSQHVEVVVIKESKLELFNIFKFQTDEDFCYYLVYLFELLKLDKEKDSIIISGITKKNDSRIIKIEEFFKKIQYSKASTQFIYSYRFNEVPQHYFSNLFVIPYEDNKRY